MVIEENGGGGGEEELERRAREEEEKLLLCWCVNGDEYRVESTRTDIPIFLNETLCCQAFYFIIFFLGSWSSLTRSIAVLQLCC